MKPFGVGSERVLFINLLDYPKAEMLENLAKIDQRLVIGPRPAFKDGTGMTLH